jgi:hypothetical protein
VCSNTFYDDFTGIYIVSILMPSLPPRYCLGVISQMLRMKRHCSPIASRDVLVGTFTNTIVSRNRSRQRHRTTYKSPARFESHLYRCLRIYVIGSRTNKEWPPLRVQRDRGFVQSACRAHSDRQAHGLGKVSLRPVTSTFGVFNGAIRVGLRWTEVRMPGRRQ